MKLHKISFLILGACVLFGGNVAVMAADKDVKAQQKAEKTAEAPPGPAWVVRCNKEMKDEGTKRGRCEIVQRLIVKETGKRFIEAAVSFPKDKSDARGVFVVPLGILLQPGLQMKIDDGKPFKFQVRYCDGNGCFGYVDLNAQILDAMKKGTKLTLTFQALNQKVINVEITLKDFVTALQEVS
jgi:invasion protein IalB